MHGFQKWLPNCSSLCSCFPRNIAKTGRGSGCWEPQDMGKRAPPMPKQALPSLPHRNIAGGAITRPWAQDEGRHQEAHGSWNCTRSRLAYHKISQDITRVGHCTTNRNRDAKAHLNHLESPFWSDGSRTPSSPIPPPAPATQRRPATVRKPPSAALRPSAWPRAKKTKRESPELLGAGWFRRKQVGWHTLWRNHPTDR